MRYLITFACYGQRLHGDDSGSVDPRRNSFGSPVLETNRALAAAEFRSMKQPPYLLDRDRGLVVLKAIREVCLQRGWSLLAAHVRTTHVHVVAEAEVRPEKVMHAFKAYASRELNKWGRNEADRKRWARHGSTGWLWKDRDVKNAIRYVIEEQGEPMAVFISELVV